jgi:hypothetical protein
MLKPLKQGKVIAGIRYTRAGLPKPYVSDKIPDALRVDALWMALAADPPVKPHCVARAMQLLNVAAIRGEMRDGAFSSVCKTRFAPVINKSLPTPGRPIKEEYGIAALASLFVDSLQNNMPVMNQGATAQAIERLRTAFGSADGDSFETVKDVTAGACVSSGTISVSGSTQAQLRSYAQILINRQASHLRSTMAIIFQLFNEKRIRAGVFEISPNVISGGMAEVNRIAVAARELLVDYYSDCETTYKLGVTVLQGAVTTEEPAAAATTAEPEEEEENAE